MTVNIAICQHCPRFQVTQETGKLVYRCQDPIEGGTIASEKCETRTYNKEFLVPLDCPHQLEHIADRKTNS